MPSIRHPLRTTNHARLAAANGSLQLRGVVVSVLVLVLLITQGGAG